MAVKKPLTITSGTVSEISSTDILDAAALPPILQQSLYSTPQEVIVTNFQTGHGWTWAYGNATNSPDTTDFVRGSQSESITATTTLSAFRSGTGTTFNMTNRCLKVWIKVADWQNLTSIAFYATDTAFTNYGSWQLVDSPDIFELGDWVSFTLSPAKANITGSPNWGLINQFQVAIQTTNSNQTIKLGSVAITEMPLEGVVSIVFDDAHVSIYSEARKKMDQYGMPGTIYLNTPSVDTDGDHLTLAQLKKLQLNNLWDICAHGVTDLTTLTLAEAEADVITTKKWLLNNGFVRGAHDFAYPNGNYNDNVIQMLKKYFRSARTVINYTESTTPPDMYRLKVFQVLNTTTTSAIQSAVTRAINGKEWLILLFHQIASTATYETQYSITNFGTVIDNIASSGVAVKTVPSVLNGLTQSKDIGNSIHGKRVVELQLNGSTALTTSDVAYFRVPEIMNGYVLKSVAAHCQTSSSSGTPTFTVTNSTRSLNMLSTNLTLDVSETDSLTATTQAVINTANDDVFTGNWIAVACTVAGTGVTFATIELTFGMRN